MDDSDFDVAILDTSLTSSILAAALASAGKRVLHVDAKEYYGANDASLSFQELVAWADQNIQTGSPSERQQFTSVSYTTPPPTSLLQASRQYSLSLSPTLIPSNGSLITSLVRSGVAKYGGYRLLEGVGVYTQPGTFTRVPSSKEDVFKDRNLSLLEKRKLMKFLMFAGSEFEGSAELQGHEAEPFLSFLQTSFSLSSQASTAIAYAIAHCSSPEEHTLPALLRLRKYLQSTGRYGNSPFLVGHYGGTGEIAQGFCRTCAVHGGTYILGRTVTSLTSHDDRHIIHISDIPEPLSAKLVVASSESLPPSAHLPNATQASTPPHLIARCIAISDRPFSFPSSQDHSTSGEESSEAKEKELDSVLLVFPPASLGDGVGLKDSVVTALFNGELTMSCPKGQYIVYLSAVLPSSSAPTSSAEEALKPYLRAIMNQAPHEESQLLFGLYYYQSIRSSRSMELPSSVILTSSDVPSVAPLTESVDSAATEAERLFWDAVKKLGMDGEEIEFFVPVENEDEEDI